MSLSLMKNCAEHFSEPQMTGNNPAICLRVIKPNVPQDGQDRTALFQLVGNEAWGQLSPSGRTLGIGPHD